MPPGTKAGRCEPGSREDGHWVIESNGVRHRHPSTGNLFPRWRPSPEHIAAAAASAAASSAETRRASREGGTAGDLAGAGSQTLTGRRRRESCCVIAVFFLTTCLSLRHREHWAERVTEHPALAPSPVRRNGGFQMHRSFCPAAAAHSFQGPKAAKCTYASTFSVALSPESISGQHIHHSLCPVATPWSFGALHPRDGAHEVPAGAATAAN